MTTQQTIPAGIKRASEYSEEEWAALSPEIKQVVLQLSFRTPSPGAPVPARLRGLGAPPALGVFAEALRFPEGRIERAPRAAVTPESLRTRIGEGYTPTSLDIQELEKYYLTYEGMSERIREGYKPTDEDLAGMVPSDRTRLKADILLNIGAFTPTDDGGLPSGDTFFGPEGWEYRTDEFGDIKRVGFDPSKAQQPSDQALTPFQQADLEFRQQQAERQFGQQVDVQQAAMIANREAAIRQQQSQSREFAFAERAQQADIAFQREQHLAELQANPRSWIEASLFQGRLPNMPEFLAPFAPGVAAGESLGLGAAQGGKSPLTPLGATFNRFTPPQQEQIIGTEAFFGTDPQEFLRGQRRISPPSGGGRVTYTR